MSDPDERADFMFAFGRAAAAVIMEVRHEAVHAPPIGKSRFQQDPEVWAQKLGLYLAPEGAELDDALVGGRTVVRFNPESTREDQRRALTIACQVHAVEAAFVSVRAFLVHVSDWHSHR
jgi:hypothetical protein